MNNPFNDILEGTATPARTTIRQNGLVSTRNTDGPKNVNGTTMNTIETLNSKLKQLGVEVEDQTNPCCFQPDECTETCYSLRPLPSIPLKCGNADPHQLHMLANSAEHDQRFGKCEEIIPGNEIDNMIKKVQDKIDEIKQIIGDFDTSAIMGKLQSLSQASIKMTPSAEVDTMSDITSTSAVSHLTSTHSVHDNGPERLIQSIQSCSDTPTLNNLHDNLDHFHSDEALSPHRDTLGTLHGVPVSEHSHIDEISPLKSPLSIQVEVSEDPSSPPMSQTILQRQPFSQPHCSENRISTLADPNIALFNQSGTTRTLFDTIGSNNRFSQRYSAGFNMRANSVKLGSAAMQGSNLNVSAMGSLESISPRQLFPTIKKEPSFHILTPSKQSSNCLRDIGTSKSPPFAEFNVVGIQSLILDGGPSFSDTNSQISEVLYAWPQFEDGTSLIVDNIPEYIFPQGAKLSLMTLSEYKRQCKRHFFEPKHKILQFTDSANRIYHAYLLIVNEVVENPSRILIQKLLHVHELNLAAETILRYFRHYQVRKSTLRSRTIRPSMKGKEGNAQDYLRNSLEGTQTVMTDLSLEGLDKNVKNPTVKRPKSRIRTFVSSALKPIKNTLIGKKATSSKGNIVNSEVQNHLQRSVDINDSKSFGRVQSVPVDRCLSQFTDDELVQFAPDSDPTIVSKKKRSYSAPDCSLMVVGAQSKILSQGGADIGSNGVLTLETHATITTVPGSISSAPTPVLSQMGRSQSSESVPSEIVDTPFPSFYTDCSLTNYPIDDHALSPTSCSNMSYPISRLAQFRENMEHYQDRVVIQEKAFCILSEAPSPLLFFKILQAIVEVEQRKKGSIAMESERVVDNILEGRRKYQLREHEFITKFVSFIHNQDLQLLMKKLQKSDINLACHPLIPSLIIPKKPPSLAEWTVGMLFSFLPVEVILHVHSLLLVEKSLIVIGRDTTLTTIVTTAFVHLLLPLKWAGIFVPLLPPLALEVLDAPMPYIIGLDIPGVYGKDATKRPKLPVSAAAAIIYMDDFLDCPHSYHQKQEQFKQHVGDIVVEKFESLSSIFGSAPSTLSQRSPMNAFLSRPTTLSNATVVESTDNFSIFKTYYRECLYFETPLLMEVELLPIFPAVSTSQVTAIDNTAMVLKPLLAQLKCLARQFKWQCEHCGLLQNSPFANIGSSRGKKIFGSAFDRGSNSCTPSCVDETMPHEVFVKCALMDFDPVIYQPVREILSIFHTYNETYTGGVLSSTYGWQDICHEDLYSRALVVDAEKIMDPLRQRICIQEHVLRTQMFAMMLDSQFASYLQLRNPRRFIYDWLQYRYRKKNPIGTTEKTIKRHSITKTPRKNRSVPFFK